MYRYNISYTGLTNMKNNNGHEHFHSADVL